MDTPAQKKPVTPSFMDERPIPLAAMDAQAEKIETLLRMSRIEAAIGLKKSTIYAMINEGKFPRPVRISARAVAWRESEIVAWQQARMRTEGEQ